MMLMYNKKKLFVDDRYNDVFDIRTFNIINGAIAEVVGVIIVLMIISLVSLIWSWEVGFIDPSFYIFLILIKYNSDGFIYMLGKVSKFISNLGNSRKNPIIERWQNLNPNPKNFYSTNGNFNHSNLLLNGYLDKNDFDLNNFLNKNFGHLQFVEYKEIGNDILHIVAFQYTSKNKDVTFYNGNQVPVFHVKNNTYMCYQGIEFYIQKHDFESILRKNNYMNINNNILNDTPGIIRQHMNDGLLTVLNVQTHNERKLEGMRVENLQLLEDLVKDIKNGIIKKD